MEEEKKETTFE
jgi:transposase